MPFLSRRRPVGRAPRCFAITYKPTFVCRIVSGRKALESSGGRGTGPAARPRCERLVYLERDVVVRPGAGARRLKVAGVGRDIALRGEAAAAAAVATVL